MSDLPLGLIVESLVAILLFVTIGYCVVLNRKLRHIRSDQNGLRDIISDLKETTATAEGAISGLSFVVVDAEQKLAKQIAAAQKISADLEARTRDGARVVAKLGAISRAANAPRAKSQEPQEPQAAERQPGAAQNTIRQLRAIQDRARSAKSIFASDKEPSDRNVA